MNRLLNVFCCVFFLTTFSGCRDDGNGIQPINSAPVADAGADQNVVTGNVVTLDGSASSDPDDDLISYSWLLTSAPDNSTASLSDDSAVRPTFTPDLEGSYVFSLVVDDGDLDSEEDFITVTVSSSNSAPVANAGADQNVATGDVVTLDGRASSDSDGDLISYSWLLTSAPDNSTASLSDDSAARPTFTPDLEGIYIFSLVVDDGDLDSEEDFITVTVSSSNSAPVANAGADQNVATADAVTLDGSGSSDADNDTLSYLWTFVSQPTASSAVLSGETTASPTFTADQFGDYVIRLVVNDGSEDSDPDTVVVSAGYQPPAGYVAVNFTIDDSANRTYLSGDGLAWKGSFSYNAVTRVLTQNGAWPGPYPMLYDDGPWTSGGHEPEGASADDNIWGVTVWVSSATTTIFEYGAIEGSVNGSDGDWIWVGSNGTVTVPAGATNAVDAPGLVIGAHGTIDMILTIDISSNGANLAAPFQGADYTGQVAVKGSAWSWMTISCMDDGTKGDLTAGDGIYTFVLSENIGPHEGLLFSGDHPEFVFVLSGVEYKEAGSPSPISVSAFVDDGSGWSSVPVAINPDDHNTYIEVP